MSIAAIVLLGVLVALALVFVVRWFVAARNARWPSRPGPVHVAIGFVTNFFDTLGIGSFAPTTSAYKLLRLVRDEQIPGTLNVGHTPAAVTQALIFIVAVTVEPTTLVPMIAASVIGAWLGAGKVARLPPRAIQVGMGFALLIAAALFTAYNLQLMPGGGDAFGLQGGKLYLAVGVNFVLAALMTLGIGLYAPCLIMVSLLGMSPLAAFPIMMGSCAFLMPTAGMRFIAMGRFDPRAAMGLALGGIPAVLLAAFVVRKLPLEWLRWLVVVVVLIAAISMLRSAVKKN